MVKPKVPEAPVRPGNKADPAKTSGGPLTSRGAFWPVIVLPVSIVLQFQAERRELLANLVERRHAEVFAFQ
jgi:hypothetical protein